MSSPASLFNRFHAVDTKGRLDLGLSLGKHMRTYLKEHTTYGQGPEIHGKPRKVSLLVGKAQQARCLKIWVSGPLECDAGI